LGFPCLHRIVRLCLLLGRAISSLCLHISRAAPGPETIPTHLGLPLHYSLLFHRRTHAPKWPLHTGYSLRSWRLSRSSPAVARRKWSLSGFLALGVGFSLDWYEICVPVERVPPICPPCFPGGSWKVCIDSYLVTIQYGNRLHFVKLWANWVFSPPGSVSIMLDDILNGFMGDEFRK